MAKRRGPIVEISGRMSLRLKAGNLQIQLERELVLPSAPVAPEQLELAIAPASIPERSALRVRTGSAPARVVPSTRRAPPADSCTCGRRGYHLKRCALFVLLALVLVGCGPTLKHGAPPQIFPPPLPPQTPASSCDPAPVNVCHAEPSR